MISSQFTVIHFVFFQIKVFARCNTIDYSVIVYSQDAWKKRKLVNEDGGSGGLNGGEKITVNHVNNSLVAASLETGSQVP